MSKRDERMRNRVVNRLRLIGSAGRAELARIADSNDYRRGTADVDRLLAEGVLRLDGNKYRLADSPPEPEPEVETSPPETVSFWTSPPAPAPASFWQ